MCIYPTVENGSGSGVVTRVPSCIMYARVVFCRPAHSRSVLFIFFVLLFSDFVAKRSEAGTDGLVFFFKSLFNK